MTLVEHTEQPWLSDPRYGGMSAASAEASWRASERQRASFPAAPQNDYGSTGPEVYGLPSGDYEPVIEIPTHVETAAESDKRIRLIPFDEIKLSTGRRDLIKGVIPKVGLTIVWGPPKCGKSFVVFDAMMHVALGWEYRGRRVHPGPVVYCAFEGQTGIEARVEAFRRKHPVPANPPFFLEPVTLDLVRDHQALINVLRTRLSDAPPVAVVLDTLNRSLAGSESSDEDMSRYVQAADAIRDAFTCAVIVVHHCGIDGSRPRGHTALTGAADAQLAVKRDASDAIITEVELAKDGPQGALFTSRLAVVDVGLDEDGETITSCVVEPDQSAPGATRAKVTGQAELCLRVLRDTIADVGTIPPANDHIPSGTRTISEKTWRSNCYAGMTTDDTTQTSRQRAFVRASNKLQSANLIGKWEDHVWLV
ncbi:hypothetical protein CSIRO_2771 [Bradyrhizobiaceae bacterium SG-6C]|nr:hypothetical protein CSIRO_2771 [Bradyrhizobiaceae bacterium SG-6C]